MNRVFSAPIRAAMREATPAPLGRLGGPLPATGLTANRAYFAASHMALAHIRELDRVNREDVTPELEPFSPSLESGEPGDFDEEENEDVQDEMEPFDPTIESSIDRVSVSGNEDEVTITAEDGETIVGVLEEDSGDLEVLVEDTGDVLLAAPDAPRIALEARLMPISSIRVAVSRATIEEHEDGSVTIHPDSGEYLDASEMAGGDVVVHVEDEMP